MEARQNNINSLISDSLNDSISDIDLDLEEEEFLNYLDEDSLADEKVEEERNKSLNIKKSSTMFHEREDKSEDEEYLNEELERSINENIHRVKSITESDQPKSSQTKPIQDKKPKKLSENKNEDEIKVVKESLIQKSNFLSSITLKRPFNTSILIDTGAIDVNVISHPHYLKLLELSLCTEAEESNHLVVPIGNQPLSTIGSTTVTFILDDNDLVKKEVPCIIVKELDQYDVILGLPAIEQLKIVPKISEGVVEILNVKYQLKRNTFIKHTEIRTINEIIIPAGKQIQVPVHADSSILKQNMNDYYEVVPSNTMLATKCLKSPRALTKNSLNYILISNLSDQKVIIKKNALVAYFRPIFNKNKCFFAKLDEIREKRRKQTIDNEENDEEKIIGDNMYIPVGDFMNSEEIKSFIKESATNLTQEQLIKLHELITEYTDLFASSSGPVGVQTKTKCFVPLVEGTVPIRLPPYRSSPKVLEKIKEM